MNDYAVVGLPGEGRPRIAEIFKKKGWENQTHQMERDRSWRVTGFYKTWVSPKKDHSNLSDEMRAQVKMTDEIMEEILAEELAEMTPIERDRKNREIKIIPCSREEAEFVSGCGVAGSILRLEDAEITGLVGWEDSKIISERNDYNPDRTEFPTKWRRYWW